jgi:hypothetical protein
LSIFIRPKARTFVVLKLFLSLQNFIKMTKLLFSFILCAFLSLIGCSTSQKAVIPFSNKAVVEDTYTIIWNGTSEAYRYLDGKWARAENYDYQFNVTQKRYGNTWKSVKSLHRLHPDYDGKAGDRDQTMYFEVDYKNLKENQVLSVISSSLGDGAGTSDKEFRNAQIVLYVKNPSSFMPFNKFRITQKYNYEEGILTETVELFKEKEGKEIPFMKNEEKAYFYVKGKLKEAPTTFNANLAVSKK